MAAVVPFFWRNLLKCLPTSTSTTTSNPDQFLSEPDPVPPPPATPSLVFSTNYNSLYDIPSSSAATDDSPPPDFAAVFASHRFFFSSPGNSNSISGSHLKNDVDPAPPRPLDGGVAFNKYSPDPYSDFKKSMEEMIESRGIKDPRGNWNYLHELLSCYLAMNPNHTHDYIISAFSDIVVRLLSSSAAAPLSPPPA